jgi:hypothetical protein
MLSTIKRVEAVVVAVVVEEMVGSLSTEEKEAGYVGAVPVAQDAEAASGSDDCPTWMTWTQFVVAYKRLSREEIGSILSRQRKPFESTDLYKDMIDDNSTTKEDLERRVGDHEYHEDRLSAWWDRVRKEYADKGFFVVDDNYIAERLELKEYYNQSMREMLSELNLDESIFGNE